MRPPAHGETAINWGGSTREPQGCRWRTVRADSAFGSPGSQAREDHHRPRPHADAPGPRLVHGPPLTGMRSGRDRAPTSDLTECPAKLTPPAVGFVRETARPQRRDSDRGPHLPVPVFPGEGPDRDRAVCRSLRQHPAGGLRGTRCQRTLQTGSGGRDQGHDGRRRPVPNPPRWRRSWSTRSGSPRTSRRNSSSRNSSASAGCPRYRPTRRGRTSRVTDGAFPGPPVNRSCPFGRGVPGSGAMDPLSGRRSLGRLGE